MSANTAANLRRSNAIKIYSVRQFPFRSAQESALRNGLLGQPIWPADFLVYFIRFSTDVDCLVKVGWTGNVQNRMYRLRHGSPPFYGHKSAVIGCLGFETAWGAEMFESKILHEMACYHVSGEWLRMPDVMQEEIHDACRDAAFLSGGEECHGREAEYIQTILKLNGQA